MTPSNTNLIICGTNTDIGKTIISALIVNGLGATYWKPIQSGLEGGGDTGRIKKILNLDDSRLIPEVYKFKAAVSPHWAAEMEGIMIDLNKLSMPNFKQQIILETAGGLMVPLTRKLLQIEQIKNWNSPVILVASTLLGTLNHTLLSLEAMRNRKIPILGIFLNGPKHEDNKKTISEIGRIPIIGHLPELAIINANTLQAEWDKQKIKEKIENLLKDLNNF